MQITVEIPDSLAIEAQALGLSLEQHLPTLLAENLAHLSQEKRAPSDEAERNRSTHDVSREAAVDRLLAFAGKYGFTSAGMDLKAMRHEGHKY